MAGRDAEVPDPDDWWSASTRAGGRAGRDPTETTQGRARGVDPDDWLEDDAGLRIGSRSFRLPFDTRILLAAVGLVVVLVVGLVVGGVFSGSSKPRPTTSSTAQSTTVTTTPPKTTASVPAPSAPLAPGATAVVQVKVLQRGLASLGFSPGAIDGSYGAGTERALERFQRAHSLAADGVLGSKTLAALKRALRR
jgi:hypothetical protein